MEAPATPPPSTRILLFTVSSQVVSCHPLDGVPVRLVGEAAVAVRAGELGDRDPDVLLRREAGSAQPIGAEPVRSRIGVVFLDDDLDRDLLRDELRDLEDGEV